MAHGLLAASYLSVVFCTYALVVGVLPLTLVLALIGFIISHIDKYPGVAKVSPRYPITKAPSSHFAALQYPLDAEMETVYTQYPPRKAKQARKPGEEERWTEIPV